MWDLFSTTSFGGPTSAGGVSFLLSLYLVLEHVLTETIARYNYVLSGALDIGTALCIVVSALALGLSGASFPDWWGNTVWENNLDAQGTAVTKTVADDGSFFGPTTWH